MEYPDAKAEATRRLDLNGARVYFRTQTIDAPLDVVLNYYEASCEDDGALLAPLAILSRTEAGRGYVACLSMNREASTLDNLAASFVRFSATGDLNELGQGRYAYAKSVEVSEENRTFLLTMWTAIGLNLHDILPLDGRDAAGSDPPDVPRPPSSQRILSSSEVGHSSSVTVYLVAASSPSTLGRYYRAAFRARGWEVLERHDGERLQIDRTNFVAARRGDETVTMLAYPGTHHRTVVTLLTVGPQ